MKRKMIGLTIAGKLHSDLPMAQRLVTWINKNFRWALLFTVNNNSRMRWGARKSDRPTDQSQTLRLTNDNINSMSPTSAVSPTNPSSISSSPRADGSSTKRKMPKEWKLTVDCQTEIMTNQRSKSKVPTNKSVLYHPFKFKKIEARMSSLSPLSSNSKTHQRIGVDFTLSINSHRTASVSAKKRTWPLNNLSNHTKLSLIIRRIKMNREIWIIFCKAKIVRVKAIPSLPRFLPLRPKYIKLLLCSFKAWLARVPVPQPQWIISATLTQSCQ